MAVPSEHADKVSCSDSMLGRSYLTLERRLIYFVDVVFVYCLRGYYRVNKGDAT